MFCDELERRKRENIKRAILYLSILTLIYASYLLLIYVYVKTPNFELNASSIAFIALCTVFITIILPVLLGKSIFRSR